MDVVVGLRVVRGPDWDDNKIDGGEGFVGTVVQTNSTSSSLPEKLVYVQWDSGKLHHHRAGYHGAYDLCVFDSSPSGKGINFTVAFSTIQTAIPWLTSHCMKVKANNP